MVESQLCTRGDANVGVVLFPGDFDIERGAALGKVFFDGIGGEDDERKFLSRPVELLRIAFDDRECLNQLVVLAFFDFQLQGSVCFISAFEDAGTVIVF